MPRPNVDDVLRNLGRRVGELRSAKGLTQAQFAEALDVGIAYVGRVEQGRQNATVASLVRIVGALGVEISALFEPSTTRARKRGRPTKPETPSRTSRRPTRSTTANRRSP